MGKKFALLFALNANVLIITFKNNKLVIKLNVHTARKQGILFLVQIVAELQTQNLLHSINQLNVRTASKISNLYNVQWGVEKIIITNKSVMCLIELVKEGVDINLLL